MKRIVLAAGMALGLVSVAVARENAPDDPQRPLPQRMMGEGMMEGRMAMQFLLRDKDLGLTSEQQQQIMAIRSSSTNEMRQLETRMRDVVRAQAELMSQDLPNEDAVLKGAEELSKLHATLNRLRLKQVLEVRKILTPEQRVKMREKMKARMDKAGMKGDRSKTRSHDRRKAGENGPGHEPPPGEGPQGE